MIEPFVSSRFLVREAPIAFPRYDLINQDTRGPVFDLGVDMDSYDGSVYIHVDHIIEMGRSLGMATTEQVQFLLDTIAGLEAKINKLPDAQEDLKNGLDSLVGEFWTRINTVDPEPSVDSEIPAEDNRIPAPPERETDGPLVL